jgi:hypothetical protein
MPTDQDALLKAMGDARKLAMQCAAAERYGTALYRKCDAFRAPLTTSPKR